MQFYKMTNLHKPELSLPLEGSSNIPNGNGKLFEFQGTKPGPLGSGSEYWIIKISSFSLSKAGIRKGSPSSDSKNSNPSSS